MAGTVVALGMVPLAGASPADENDRITDPPNPLSGVAPVAGGGRSDTAWFDPNIYLPTHDDIEQSINSPLRQDVDSLINTPSGQYLIDDGAGQPAAPDGADPWLWLGDSGPGTGVGDGGPGGQDGANTPGTP